MRVAFKALLQRRSLRDSAVLVEACRDLVGGFYGLRPVRRAVTVFGSARFGDGHEFNALAEEVGELLAREGFEVVTGGGPSTMAAANRGAKKAGGYSVGCGILTGHERKPNGFAHTHVDFRHFFARKFIMARYAVGFVVMPGGFGTLDELTEVMTLMLTRKMADKPVVLVGSAYWGGLIRWMEEVMVASGALTAAELSRLRLVDTAEEAVAVLRREAPKAW